MGQLLYFIDELPGKPLGNLDDLMAALDLTARFEGGPNRLACRGPANHQGLLLSAGKPQYRPAEQTWAGPYCERLHIGYWNEDPPTPADLARPRQVDGGRVNLAGDEWLIPAARFAPHALMVIDGEAKQEPLELATRLFEHVSTYLPFVCGSNTDEIDLVELLGVCAECLAVNYRISSDPAQELSILKLVSSTDVLPILQAMMDWATLMEAAVEEKKTA